VEAGALYGCVGGTGHQSVHLGGQFARMYGGQDEACLYLRMFATSKCGASRPSSAVAAGDSK